MSDITYYLRKKKREQEEQQKQQNTGVEVLRNENVLFVDSSKKKKLRGVLNWSDGSFGL